MDRHDIDALHQAASGHYLEGDYQAALVAWQRLLEEDPGDEQAREGARLCEQLLGGNGASADADSFGMLDLSDDAGSALGSGELSGEDDSFGMLELPEDTAATSASADDPFADLAGEMAEPATSEDEDDPFADLEAPVRSRRETAPAEMSEELRDSLDELDKNLDLGPVPTFESSGSVRQAEGDDETVEVSSVSSDEEAAAAELRRRVNELLAAALSAMERGDREETLVLLDRMLILDEENEAAASLRERIRQEMEPAPGGAAAASRAAGDDLWDDDEIALDANEPQVAPTPPQVSGPPPPAPAKVSSPSSSRKGGTVWSPPPPEPDPEPGERASAKDAKRKTSPAGRSFVSSALEGLAFWKRVRMPRLYGRMPYAIGASIVILALGGWLGWQWLAGGATSAAGGSAAEPTPAPGSPAVSAAVEPPSAGVPAAKPQPATDLDNLLARADTAFRKEDYAAAVLAYGQALKLDPENLVAQERLRAAGEHYRVQEEQTQRWKQAELAFDNGDYRTALQSFYRLPRGEDSARIDRYLFNGWFNMGVESLRGGDCTQALESLKEAEALRPADSGVRNALTLARICTRERRTTSYLVAAQALQIRKRNE